MTGDLILIYVLIGAIAVYSLRKLIVNRSIPHYTPGQVQERLRDGRGMLLLDVRTDREWRQQHIKGALHIPLHELYRRIDELEKHKNREIICYCQTGNRSVSAAIRLKRLGFTAANMKGGLAEWNYQNLK